MLLQLMVVPTVATFVCASTQPVAAAQPPAAAGVPSEKPQPKRSSGRGLWVSGGPTIAVTSDSSRPVEYGFEPAVWLLAMKRLNVGVDGGLSNRAWHLEGQVLVSLMKWLGLGASGGVAWRRPDHRMLPQVTLWSLFATRELPIPVLPFVRLTGLDDTNRVWQAGLMFKVGYGVDLP
jgi:hypothetical protein